SLTLIMIPLTYSQVGINTETPRGALEVSSGNDQNQGFVLPQVSSVEAVVNTQNSEDEVPSGTVVFDLSRDAVCYKHADGWCCVSVSGSIEVVGVSENGVSEQQAYVKASHTGDYDYFGHSVSLLADGNTLAVGAVLEDSNATGIGGDQTNNNASNSGAV